MGMVRGDELSKTNPSFLSPALWLSFLVHIMVIMIHLPHQVSVRKKCCYDSAKINITQYRSHADIVITWMLSIASWPIMTREEWQLPSLKSRKLAQERSDHLQLRRNTSPINLVTFLKALSPNIVILRARTSTHMFWRHNLIHSIIQTRLLQTSQVNRTPCNMLSIINTFKVFCLMITSPTRL